MLYGITECSTLAFPQLRNGDQMTGLFILWLGLSYDEFVLIQYVSGAWGGVVVNALRY
jgi:hypothetical protein